MLNLLKKVWDWTINTAKGIVKFVSGLFGPTANVLAEVANFFVCGFLLSIFFAGVLAILNFLAPVILPVLAVAVVWSVLRGIHDETAQAVAAA